MSAELLKLASPEWIAGVEAERNRIEEEFWTIVDADGPCGLPSDMMEAVRQLTRAARNRDMWKGQCERQSAALRALAATPSDGGKA